MINKTKTTTNKQTSEIALLCYDNNHVLGIFIGTKVCLRGRGNNKQTKKDGVGGWGGGDREAVGREVVENSRTHT